jgi:Xaa-Pro aminopeptidase
MQTEYAKRRLSLGEKLSPSSIAILPSANLLNRNADTEHPFRQDSNFYYLTGFDEPEALLVLRKEKNGQLRTILFCRPNCPAEEVWVGPRMGMEGAIKQLGVDFAYSIEELDKMMPSLLENNEYLYYTLGVQDAWDLRVIHWLKTARRKIRAGIRIPKDCRDFNSFIHEQRLIKSENEIKLLRKAAEISVNAHKRLMQYCRPNQYEYELEAEFLHECYQKGCRAVAYSSIIAGGSNACILHYTQNNKPLKNNDLVLVDAGGEYQYYAADITRTFPVNGRFSEEQKKIYQLVLDAQVQAIHEIRPGISYNKIQEIIVAVLVQGLVTLNILQGEVEELIKKNAYKQFYLHSSGHWLGLDVHDAGDYKIEGEWRALQPGMTLTVEPGIYIPPGQKEVDPRWWGIGVRIEDDILVTATGHEVLTHGAPKTVEEIERWMNTSKENK